MSDSEHPSEEVAAASVFVNWTTFIVNNYSGTHSSCPGYKGKPPGGKGGQDKDQNMNAAAVTELKNKGVKFIISGNREKLNNGEKQRLAAANIGFLHLPVKDGGAPSNADFKSAHQGFVAHKNEHIHMYCGWGDGRTGTYLTGIQILEGVYDTRDKPGWDVWNRQKVEEDVQRRALDALWTEWRRLHPI